MKGHLLCLPIKKYKVGNNLGSIHFPSYTDILTSNFVSLANLRQPEFLIAFLFKPIFAGQTNTVLG